MSYYGSGQRLLDESKAASCRDCIAEYTRLIQTLQPDSPERLAMEARIGREALRLAEIESRLAHA